VPRRSGVCPLWEHGAALESVPCGNTGPLWSLSPVGTRGRSGVCPLWEHGAALESVPCGNTGPLWSLSPVGTRGRSGVCPLWEHGAALPCSSGDAQPGSNTGQPAFPHAQLHHP
ncbi:hypothetical protein NHX12_013678, partial [Muraenolepis orangiensis]